MTISTPLKTHGGKAYLASRIVSLMPPRCKKPNAPDPSDPGWLHYVEPYFGGGSVLLAMDPEGISEAANDLHSELMLFWATLRDEAEFTRFKREVEATPFSQEDFDVATECDGPLAFFVRARQSLSGRQNSFSPTSRNRTRRGMNEQAAAWLTAIEGLPEVHTRLKRVLILNGPALEVIASQDGPRTLFYLDPPYLHETRVAKGVYKHEMTHDQHAALLCALVGLKGRFLLSGYRSDLYDRFSADQGWIRHDFAIPNHAAGGKKKRKMTECVWANFHLETT